MMPKNKQKKSKGMQVANSMLKNVVGEIKPYIKQAVKAGLLSAGETAGNMLEAQTGIKNAGDYGRRLARRLSKIVGSGDYTVNDTPVFNSLIGKKDFPATTATTFGDGGFRIKNREYLGELKNGGTANTFYSSTYTINAGLLGPLLSQLAANYEEYKVHGLVFEFHSTTSPYLSTSAMGSIIMSMLYNPAAPPFTSKVNMANSEHAITFRPDESGVYGVECEKSRTDNFLVRVDNTVGAGNPIYDFGVFTIATQLAASAYANMQLGEIWVSYDIELMKPRLSTSPSSALHLQVQSSGNQSTGLVPASTSYNVAVATGQLVSGTIDISTSGGPLVISMPNLIAGQFVYVVWNISTDSTTNPLSTAVMTNYGFDAIAWSGGTNGNSWVPNTDTRSMMLTTAGSGTRSIMEKVFTVSSSVYSARTLSFDWTTGNDVMNLYHDIQIFVRGGSYP